MTDYDNFDAMMYDAATQPINTFAGHQPRLDEVYLRPEEPTQMEYFEFNPHSIYDPNNSTRLYWVATDDGLDKIQTDRFKIAFTRWGYNNSGPFVLVNHGVPANQTQWYDVIRLLTRVGFRVIVFDMLGMGWSTKPLFDNQEKLEKLRWDKDIHYVNQLVDYVFGENEKFVYLADDWGTGIQIKYIEIFWNRVLWAGDQDGIRGGAYPVPEIEDIGQASMLPMDEDPDVISGKKPPSPGSFQMAMGASNQGITQMLKTMAHRSPERYNQWSMRDTLRPFFSTNYEKSGSAPFNMPHKNYALKSMADRAVSALRTGDLMPYHPQKNPEGIKFSQIETIMYLWSGEYDRMMSANQRLRYKFWMPKSQIFSSLVPRADHFSGVDQPEWIATMIVEFHNFLFPPGSPGSLPVAFLGFDGIWKGNELPESQAYSKIYQ